MKAGHAGLIEHVRKGHLVDGAAAFQPGMSGFDNSGYHIVQHQSGFLRKRTAAVFINQQLQRRTQPFCESALRATQKIAAELLVFLHDAKSFHEQRTGGFLIGAAPRDTPVREIAKQLQNEKILTPTCYFDSKGWKISREPQENPCRWCNTTVANILNDMEFTGCAINFKSSTVSYKVHDRIRKPQEEWQIIPNTQEPIIDDETFQRVQEIRSHRKRRTSTGKTSILTPKMFCGDCGAKLYYHAGRNVKDGSEYFRCSQ